MIGHARGLEILFALVIAAAFTGFLVGLGEDVRIERPPAHRDAGAGAPAHVLDAVTYSQLPARVLGPNREFVSRLDQLVAGDVVQIRADRGERRAFEGAPPTVPHPVDQQDPASCLSCHGQPTVIDGCAAPQMSHAEHTSCTQCHVESINRHLPARAPLATNGFDGANSAAAKSRAYEGAPPVIPHPTMMRSACNACHGAHGRLGLAYTHEARTNCTQCHALSAALDQRAWSPRRATPRAREKETRKE